MNADNADTRPATSPVGTAAKALPTTVYTSYPVGWVWPNSRVMVWNSPLSSIRRPGARVLRYRKNVARATSPATTASTRSRPAPVRAGDPPTSTAGAEAWAIITLGLDLRRDGLEAVGLGPLPSSVARGERHDRQGTDAESAAFGGIISLP